MADAALLALIRARRMRNLATGRAKKKLRKPLELPFPKHLEREYERRMRVVTGEIWDVTRSALFPKLAEFVRIAQGDAARQDSIWGDLIRRVFSGMVVTVGERVNPEDIAQNIGEQIDRHNRAEQEKQFKHILGVDVFASAPDLRELLDDFVADNVGLIKSIPTRYFEELEGIVTRGVRTGIRVEEMQSQIEQRFNVSKSRAELIARDQVGKFNGQLTRERQRKVGVSKYRWKTSGDSRVRDDHQDLEGTIHRWDDPPVVNRRTGSRGHPGEDIQCRCRALPVMEEFQDLA